jgi:hypothetical protein
MYTVLLEEMWQRRFGWRLYGTFLSNLLPLSIKFRDSFRITAWVNIRQFRDKLFQRWISYKLNVGTYWQRMCFALFITERVSVTVKLSITGSQRMGRKTSSKRTVIWKFINIQIDFCIRTPNIFFSYVHMLHVALFTKTKGSYIANCSFSG